MQSHSQARRHFYCAFYKWASLSAGPRLHSHITRHASLGHAFHDTARDGSGDRSQSPAQTVGEDARTRKPIGKPLDTRESQRLHPRLSEQDQPQQPRWINAPIQTSAEFPFSRLPAWEAAVRYKSESQLVIEYAIPIPDFQSLQRHYNADLIKLANETSARIELGHIGMANGNQSLLVSGNIDAAKELDKILRSNASVETSKDGSKGNTTTSRKQLYKSWLAGFPVRDETQLPSSSIKPWSFVLRHSPDTPQITMETILPASLADESKGKIYAAAKEHKVSVTYYPPSHVEGLGMMRACTFRGIVPRLQHMHAWFRRFRDSHLGHQVHVDVPIELQNLDRVTSRNLRRAIARKANLATIPPFVDNFERTGRTVLTLTGEPENPDKLTTAALIAQEEFLMRMRDPSDPEQRPVLAERTRSIFRAATHPVVVIASSGPPTEDSPADVPFKSCRGVTVSSFNTVTLEPSPIVSFNLKLPSRSWDAIEHSKFFRVHILQASAQGAAVAHAFTTPYDHAAEPFARLQSGGATITEHPGQDREPPEIEWGEAVLATLKARLILKKCIRVKDHMVAIAQIHDAKILSQNDEVMKQTQVLAYAKRHYRALGKTIDPKNLEVDGKKANTEESLRTPAEHTHVTSHAHGALTPQQNTGVIPSPSNAPVVAQDDGIALEKVERSSVDISPSKDVSSTASLQQPLTASQEATSIIEQQSKAISLESPALKVDQPLDTSVRALNNEVQKTAGNEIVHEGQHLGKELQKEIGAQHEDQKTSLAESSNSTPPPSETAAQQVLTLSSSGPLSTANKRPHPVQPKGVSSFSTLTRARPDSHRSFATKTTKSKGPTRKRLSETMLKTTVAEFFSEDPDVFVRPERIRSLLRLQSEGYRASQALKRGTATGNLPAEEAIRLEEIVRSSRQTIAKTLAVRAAKDLRRMLDRGRVDVERAQWMETAIEEGQAVMLEEAHQVRQAAKEGKMSKEEFDEIKKKMEVDFELLKTEAMRLRAMTDDDESQGS